jgi:pilus assembly protein CpaC
MKTRHNTRLKKVGFWSLIVLMMSTISGVAYAANTSVIETNQPEKLELVVGKSVTMKSSQSVKRVSIGDPEIADFILISPKEVYLTGKAPGTTNLTLWQNKKVVSIYDLEVSYDVSALKQKLNLILPNEKDLTVFASGNSITLSGRISSTANLSQVLSLAEAYAPKENVRNLVEVAGIHQVMLEVRVAEIQKTLLKQLGVNFTYDNGDEFGGNLINNLATLVDPNDANLNWGPYGLFVSPAVNALFRFNKGNSTWTGFVDALHDDGLLKVLAEPTLIALSGETASFLAGGEFPIPVPQGLGTVAIEYKPYGVALGFTPIVIGEDKINITVAPEVSELDFSTAVRIEGFFFFFLTSRGAKTIVDLADGQSFAIAGLLSERVRDSYSRYPKLGDIPVLGALFQSRNFQKQESELVIIVTPHLVKPLDMESQTLPTDFYIEPNDWDIYFGGHMEGQAPDTSAMVRGEMDGDFGHAIPLTETE